MRIKMRITPPYPAPTPPNTPFALTRALFYTCTPCGAVAQSVRAADS